MRNFERSLKSIRLLKGVSDETRSKMSRRCHWREYEAKQHVLEYRDLSTNVLFIVSGTVRVSIFSASGREVSFGDKFDGQIIGDFSAVDGQPRSASVVALTDCVVASMTSNDFWHALDNYPGVAQAMVRRLTGEARRLSERVYEFSVLAVKNRIHAELLHLARDVHGAVRNVIDSAPTHAEIASRVSTHREAVSREMSALARDQIIETRKGKLIVRDIGRLENLVHEITQE